VTVNSFSLLADSTNREAFISRKPSTTSGCWDHCGHGCYSHCCYISFLCKRTKSRLYVKSKIAVQNEANHNFQSQNPSAKQQCSGMFSKKAWGGSVDPFILLKFVKPDNIPDNEDPIVSVVIFEWADKPRIGVYPAEDSVEVSNIKEYSRL